MTDVTLSPVTPVTNGAIVTTDNPLPVYLVGGVAATSITVGTTVIVGGANGRALYDNSGVLGEFALGTGVQTALGVNTGSAGAMVLFNGAGGTPSSITLTNGTGLPPTGINATGDTWANVPAAAGASGKLYYATNFGTPGNLLRSDGTRWRPVNGHALLASADAPSSNIGNTDTVVFQYLVPINVWQLHDRLRLWFTLVKSGGTDTCALNIRCGTAGTTSDTAIIGALTVMAAGDLQYSKVIDFRLDVATSSQAMGQNANPIGYGGANSTGAYAIPVTITSAAANALYISVTIKSSNTNNTVALNNAILELIPTAN